LSTGEEVRKSGSTVCTEEEEKKRRFFSFNTKKKQHAVAKVKKGKLYRGRNKQQQKN
jgi:hypothetical protein